MQSKNELRVWAKNIRKSLNIKEISEKILNNFLALDCYKNAKNIAAYYPYGTEINIKELFNDENINFYLPVISQTDNSMSFQKYSKNDLLYPNKYGIFEPSSELADISVLDLIIIPALMADKCGYRLGYGKGYYDRFLSEKNISCPKITLIPDELLAEKLPADEFDIPVNTIITQSKVINI